MFQSLVIAFREGMEMFLIVAITLAYLNRTDRAYLAKPVYYGAGAAAVASVILGFWLETLSDNPMTEAVLALTAGVLVGSFTIHMLRAAKNVGGNIRRHIDTQAAREGKWAFIGIFLFVMLMITREGMETVLMISAASYGIPVTSLVGGILCGLALAALMGYFWVRKSHLIHIGRFLKVSAIFLILFSVQLILHGLHELSETGQVGFLNAIDFHTLTEYWGDDDGMGFNLITYSLAIVPLLWLAVVSLKERFFAKVATH